METSATKKPRKRKQVDLFPASDDSVKKEETTEKKTVKYKNTLLFDYLANILTEKSLEKFNYHVDSLEFLTSFQGFMVLKYLSMHKSPSVRNLILSNQSALERLSARALYRFLLMNVPRQYSPFIKYIKPSEKKV